jgi:chloramphenicol O-acetyltransferase
MQSTLNLIVSIQAQSMLKRYKKLPILFDNYRRAVAVYQWNSETFQFLGTEVEEDYERH